MLKFLNLQTLCQGATPTVCLCTIVQAKRLKILSANLKTERPATYQSMLLKKPYLVKWSTKGEEGMKYVQKTVQIVYI